MDPILDSTAGGRPNFLTAQWSLVVAASTQGDAASRDALAAPEGMTAEKVFDARWAAAMIGSAFARLRAELEGEDKGHLFQALKGFLLGTEDASYQQIADSLGLSLGAVKTVIYRLRGRYRTLLREELARTVVAPADVDEKLRYLRTALRG